MRKMPESSLLSGEGGAESRLTSSGYSARAAGPGRAGASGPNSSCSSGN